MGKSLLFHKQPTLDELAGLEINGSKFVEGEGYIFDGIILHIRETFRFQTKLEVAELMDGRFMLVATQFLSRGPDLWEMDAAFSRIGNNSPEIAAQMRQLSDALINRGLAYWSEE